MSDVSEVVFDDIVTDEHGSWSQVCASCIEDKDLPASSDPCGDCICGVEGCENEAIRYIEMADLVKQ